MKAETKGLIAALIFFLLVVISFCSLATPLYAQSITFTNDVFAPDGRDRWLSNDVRLSYGKWTLGQEIYTPTNKRSAEIPVGDRPWDGYLYAEYSHRFGIDKSRTLKARAGALGDASRAKRTQKFIHNDLGFGSDPQGWNTQNPSEAALDLIYEHGFYDVVDSMVGLTEVDGSYGVRAGNVRISGWIDQEIKKGFNLGAVYLRLVGGIRGELVAYNTFLDGRVFHDDVYTVERQPFVATAKAGFEIRRRNWFLRYVYSYMTEEFEGQEGRHLFGSVEIGRKE
jgi:lipid A 3-O-deacylase